MKRLHLHLSVEDLTRSIRFYSALFAAEPTVREPDHATWVLDGPRVTFAISSRGAAPGLGHLGLEVESRAALREVHDRLQRAEGALQEGGTPCCLAFGKARIGDPQGLSWEITAPALAAPEAGCCTPETPQGACCPPKPALPAGAPCCGASGAAA